MESLSDPGGGLSAFCPQQLCGRLATGPPGYHCVWILFPFPPRPHKPLCTEARLIPSVVQDGALENGPAKGWALSS